MRFGTLAWFQIRDADTFVYLRLLYLALLSRFQMWYKNIGFGSVMYPKKNYNIDILIVNSDNGYRELSGVSEENTNSSDMEAMYLLRWWQRRREVIVDLAVLCEMKSTRFWANASRYMSGIILYIGRAKTQIIPHRPFKRMSRTSRSILEWKPLAMATSFRLATSIAQSSVGSTERVAILLEAK